MSTGGARGSPDSGPQPPTARATATRPGPGARQKLKQQQEQEHALRLTTPARVFAFLLGLRVANALVVRTFFQPDEYFQSLEPAWQLAFGRDSGAWITWEWRAELRSSLHPALFAAVYTAADLVARASRVDAGTRAQLLLAAPKICQALIAALGDYYTWTLAEALYRPHRPCATATLALTAFSPWQWFCSTRTLSNSLETTLTVAALSFWPWHQLHPTPAKPGTTNMFERGSTSPVDHASDPTDPTAIDRPEPSPRPSDVRPSLLLAAAACILRPTNALIWLVIGSHTLLNAPGWAHRATWFRQALICGCVALSLAALSDRIYYGVWTLPPLNFVHFNVARDVAVFYGRNRADYYLTEGLPLLLTTALPFALHGLWNALRGTTMLAVGEGKSRNGSSSSSTTTTTTTATISLFAWTTLVFTAAMSLIAHKEVRFLYPLLPLLHILCGAPLARFAAPAGTSVARRAVLAALLALNLAVALYTSQYHQRGVVDVTAVLRDFALRQEEEGGRAGPNVTAAFLMPCHSTPWRSHLVAPNLHAWALTCEPPLDVPLSERAGYLDEADRFYTDPAAWLAGNMAEQGTAPGVIPDEHSKKRVWPEYLVFFQALEPELTSYVSGSTTDLGYTEYWRGFNSHWHDDWRRKGDVVVWRRRV